MTSTSSNDVYKFPRDVLKKELELARTAWVDIQTTTQNSLTKILKKSKEVDPESADVVISSMLNMSENLLTSIDKIVDEVYTKLENDPDRFKVLLDDLRKARLQTTLEGAKITLDEKVLNTVAIEPIDFTKLEVKVPAGLEKKIEDDTPAYLKNLRDNSAIFAEIKKLEPSIIKTQPEFASMKETLLTVVGRDAQLDKLGYTIDKVKDMNQFEYHKKSDQKLFFFIGQYSKIKCLRFHKDEWWAEVTWPNESVPISSKEVRSYDMIWLERIKEPILAKLFLQDLEWIIRQIEAMGYSGDEKIAAQISTMYYSLTKEKDTDLNKLLIAKLDHTIELLNRRMAKNPRYYDYKNGMKYAFANDAESAIKEIKKSEHKTHFSESLLRFFENKHMHVILGNQKKIADNIITLEKNIMNSRDLTYYDEQKMTSLTNDISSNIYSIDSLLEKPKSFIQEDASPIEWPIYKEAQELRQSLIAQLQKVIDIWNRQDPNYFRYLKIEKSASYYLTIKKDYISDNPSESGFKKMAADENALLFHEKRYFQKAQNFIGTINRIIDAIKDRKQWSPENDFNTLAMNAGQCHSALENIRIDSPLKSMADDIMKSLNQKMQTLVNIYSQDKNSSYTYSYKSGSTSFNKGTDYSYDIKDKIETVLKHQTKTTESRSNLFDDLLQTYSTEIAQEYISFQNWLEKANKWEDDTKKIDRLLKIKQDDWERIINRIQDLQSKSKDKNITEVWVLLNNQRNEALATMTSILTEMNKPLEPYAKNDVKEIPYNTHQTISKINQYKQEIEKQYPSFKWLKPMEKVWEDINENTRQLNTLNTQRTIFKEEQESRYKDVLPIDITVKEFKPEVSYLENNIKLKQYLTDVLYKKEFLTGYLKNNITNTYVRSELETILKGWIRYEKLFTQEIQITSQILTQQYTNLPEKDALLSLPQITKLRGIFENFKNQRMTIEEDLKNSQLSAKQTESQSWRNALEKEKTESAAINTSYNNFEALCDLAGIVMDDILKIDYLNTTPDTFQKAVDSLVKKALIKESSLKDQTVRAQILAFVARHKKQIELENKIPSNEKLDPNKIVQDMIIDKFLEDTENYKWVDKVIAKTWIKARLEEDALESWKEKTYPDFIQGFVGAAMSNRVDQKISNQLGQQHETNTKVALLERQKHWNVFIKTINTQSLLDYTDYWMNDIQSVKQSKWCPDGMGKMVREDASIKKEDRQIIDETMKTFRTDYWSILENKSTPDLSLKTAYTHTPYQQEKLDALYTLFSDKIPKVKKEEFEDIIKMLGRRNNSQFDTSFLNSNLEHISSRSYTQPLVNTISFKEFTKKVDMTKPLEVEQLIQVIITKIMSLVYANNISNVESIKKWLYEYIDTIFALPPDALPLDYITIGHLESYRNNMPGYKDIIVPARKFELMTNRDIDPWLILKSMLEKIFNNPTLKTSRASQETYETNKTAYEKSKTSFWEELDKDTKDGFIAALDILSKTFPDDKDIKSKYNELISFDRNTLLWIRKKNIIKLNPAQKYESAILWEQTNIDAQKQVETNLLITAKDNTDKYIKEMRHIIQVFNDEFIRPEWLPVIANSKTFFEDYVYPTQQAETRQAFENRIRLLIEKFTSLVSQIKTEEIPQAINKDGGKKNEAIIQLEETIQKLKIWTLNYFKQLEPTE